MSGYISPTKALHHADRLIAWREGQRPAPVTVEWDLSNRCVLGCQDCHFAHTHTRGPWATKPRTLPMAFESTGDFAPLAMVERGLTEMAAAGVRGVIWSGGGEPTTHPAWLSALRMAKRVGLEQGMYTCGGLITPQTGPAAAELLSWVVVSLDAADAATYAAEKGVAPSRFQAACDGVVALIGGTAVVGVSFLLHAQNWTQAYKMRRLAADLGATYVTFRPAILTSPAQPGVPTDSRAWVTEALPTLQALAADPFVECQPDRFVAYRDWARGYSTCHGIKLNTTITPDGRMWVCPQRRGVAGSQFGDLRRESFAEAWLNHPGQWEDFDQCRVMCRLHQVNQEVAPVFAQVRHEAFV